MRLVITSILITLSVPAHAITVFTAEEAAILQQGLIATADEFILPAYQDQATAAGRMNDALSDYCAGAAGIEKAQAAFADTFLAWQRVSIINIGPIADAEGPMRVQMWPDPKGFARRAVRNAVRAADPGLLENNALAGRTIALTNLTALEQLLYGDLQSATYACDLAQSIAAFQTSIAREFVAQWTPGSAFRSSFDTAENGNERYPNVDTLVREMLAGAVVHVDRLRKFKLLRGLGDDENTGRPERTEARASGLGLRSIEVSFRALGDFYNVPFGLFDLAPDIGGSTDGYLLSETAASVADSLAVETSTLAQIVQAGGAPADELRRYADLVLYQESFLKTGFPASIGLSAGFTAADGD
ncbi:MAG: imelysin family protein [Pseudomonadota bacterium]